MQRIYLKLGDGTSSLALSLYQSLCVHVWEREISFKLVLIIWPIVTETGKRCSCLHDLSCNFLLCLSEFWM